MFAVPLYFQVTSSPRPSATVAGAHLVPAVVGNAVGGIISGSVIKRSGRYKSLIIWAVTCSSIGYLLLMLRWHGNTNWFESLYIFPGGFGMGVASSALFISLQTVIDPAHMAPAVSFMYLMQTVSSTIGLPAAYAIMQTVLRKSLRIRLLELGYSSVEVAEVCAGLCSVLVVQRVYLLLTRRHRSYRTLSLTLTLSMAPSRMSGMLLSSPISTAFGGVMVSFLFFGSLFVDVAQELTTATMS